MRTKTLLLVGALGAAGIASSMAQAVYSVNVVGYVNLPVVAGWNMVANPLKGTNNNINTIIPSAPDGSLVNLWDAANQTFFDGEVFIEGAGWLPGTASLDPGKGMFLAIPPGQGTTLTFVGEVPQGDFSMPIAVNYNLISHFTPQAIGVGAANFPAKDGDLVLFWNPTTQAFKDGYVYIEGAGFLPEDPVPAVGEGFFIARDPAQGTSTWTRTFNVSP